MQPHRPLAEILDEILEPVTTPLSYLIQILSMFSQRSAPINNFPLSSLDQGIPHWEISLLQELIMYLESKATTSLWPGLCLIALLAAYASWSFVFFTHEYDIPQRGPFRCSSFHIATRIVDMLIRTALFAVMACAYLSVCACLAEVHDGAPEIKDTWTLSDDRLPLTAYLNWLWDAMHLHTWLRSAISYAAR